MKDKVGVILRKVVFAVGVIYGVNLFLKNLNINIPINLITISYTSFLGIPGLLSLFTLCYLIS